MTPEELARTRCPLQKNLGSVKSLAIHQHRMHPELFGMEALPSSTSTSPIQCSECGIYVSSRLHLDYHIRNTHERVQRHICEECGKGFKFQCHLEAHMIVHRTEREFVCHLCGLDYPVKQSLVKHMSKFHSDAATKSEEAGGSGEIFSCKYCELTSPFKVVIQRHQLTHKKEMGHQCEICQSVTQAMPGSGDIFGSIIRPKRKWWSVLFAGNHLEIKIICKTT
ncbi:Zinc finger and BTB domain-containing protein 48 [Orchesella cincta]|uniref:Zinc finger and BTB domain-containing protein 48 n=1 Tax=Orchesella cincta TaxID=48709 RepID=A0A1D2MCA1_ORCCI|nr:Zinc finger and BTB domain-containing protein 48 [Orchesella cincta]